MSVTILTYSRLWVDGGACVTGWCHFLDLSGQVWPEAITFRVLFWQLLMCFPPNASTSVALLAGAPHHLPSLDSPVPDVVCEFSLNRYLM